MPWEHFDGEGDAEAVTRKGFFLDTSGVSRLNIRRFVYQTDRAGARSSGGERLLDTQEVGGSIPPVPTIQLVENKAPEITPGPSCFHGEAVGNTWPASRPWARLRRHF